ncbi:MAG TPA: DUF3943 domain-containing protein, partial [Fibrobacteria bacterium]|nr:DUF3943 domain-containing protein [Fibrobacteria bacterium]
MQSTSIPSVLLAAAIAGATQPASVADSTQSKPPSWIAPTMQIFGINMAMGSVNRFVRDVEYAKIDRETIWHNLSSEWVWDDNNFEVNQIGHPVQGSLYYSAARANGHGYLMGLAYTTLGSIHWEYFMETEPPALNDLITTRMGGAMIGETTWRLAELLSGESTGERVGWLRKSGAFLVNPMFGMDRLING